MNSQKISSLNNLIKSNKIKALILVLLLALLIVSIFLVSNHNNFKLSKSSNEVEITFIDYPIFNNIDSNIKVTIPFGFNAPIENLQVKINKENIETYKGNIEKLSPTEYALNFIIENNTKEIDLNITTDNNQEFKHNIQLDSAPKILGLKTHTQEKTIEIFLNKDLSNKKNKIHLEIPEIKNNDEISLNYEGSKIFISSQDFRPNKQYILEFSGELQETGFATFANISSYIKFSNDGGIIPSIDNVKLSIKSRKIEEANVKITKIYKENISSLLYSYEPKDNYLYNLYYLNRYGDEIHKQEIKLDSSDKEIQTTLDLGGIIKENGVYVVEVSDSSCDDFCGIRQDTKIIFVSNIAITARQDAKKIIVNAFDYQTNEPIKNAQISLISTSNQILETIKSNDKGEVTFNEYKDNIFYIRVSYQDDINYLRFVVSNDLIDGLDFTGIKFSENDKFNFFSFVDRDIINPGESIHLNAILKDSKDKINNPILLSIINPKGDTIVNKILVKPIEFGLYTYEFQTDSNSLSGKYQFVYEVNGKSFYKNFQVEAIIPNKIRTQLKLPDTISGNSIKGNINAQYLTGQAGANLKSSFEISAKTFNFSSKNFSDFKFYDKKISLNSMDSKYIGNAILDANGNADFVIDIDKKLQNKNIICSVQAKVFEPTGRAVSDYEQVKIINNPQLVGVKLSSSYVNLQKPLKLPVIVVDILNDSIVSGVKLNYKIYRTDRWWWYDHDKDLSVKIKQDTSVVKIAQGSITTTDKISEINEDLSKVVKDYDSVFIEISEENKEPVYIELIADFYDEQIGKNPSRLTLKLGKNNYLTNETATLSFKAPKNSKALITISQANNIISHELIDTIEGQNDYKIKLDSSYIPNIYASVTLLKPRESKSLARRSYGFISIPISDESIELKPIIEVENKVKPNSLLNIKISNAKKEKMAYTLAIVDEGILDITNFKTPNPIKELYSKLAFSINEFDNYHNFLGKILGVVNQSVLIGGDDFDNSINNKNIKKDASKNNKQNVVYFISGVSNEKGEANIKYQLPSMFNGRVKVMLVGVNETATGSTESSVIVSDYVNLFSNIPNELKLNDKVLMPIEILPEKDVKLHKAELSVDNKEITILDSNKLKLLSFNPKKLGKTSFNITLTADTDKGKVIQKQNHTINIVSPNPSITKTQTLVLQKGESKKISSIDNFIDSEINLKISSNLIPNAEEVIDELLTLYPYDLNQIVSSNIPLLLDFDIAHTLNKEQTIARINKAIMNLISYQNWDGSFSKINNQNYYITQFNNSYVGLFLIIAKNKGFEFPESVLIKWKKYINNNMYRQPKIFQAFNVFLLALNKTPNIDSMNELYTMRDKLNTFELAALSAAYKLSGLDELSNNLKNKLNNLELESNFKEEVTNIKDNKYIIYVLLNPLTQRALSAYFMNIIEDKPNIQLVSHIAKTLETDLWLSHITQATSLLTMSNIKYDNKVVNFSIDNKPESNKESSIFKVKKDSTITAKDLLYLTIIEKGILDSNPLLENAINENLIIHREFFAADKKTPINVTNLKLNSTFYMKLTLTNTSYTALQNVALEQIIPSGWEIENTRIVNNNDEVEDSRWKQFDYVDIKSDRLFAYANYIYNFNSNNDKVIWIKLNTTIKGEFILSPTMAQTIYAQEAKAKTKALKVKVE